MKRNHKNSLRHAVRRKVDALKAEAERLTGDLAGEEKNISRLQCRQSELIAKLARAALRKVEIQKDIARLSRRNWQGIGGLKW